MDIISGGRVNFGVGAGWFRDEALSYGVYWGKHRERVFRMLEALEIILKLWTEEGNVTYEGKYYRVINAPFWPKPAQKPHPPIWFGGSSNIILEATAKYGNGLLPLSNTPIEDFKKIASRVAEIRIKEGKKILLAPSLTYPDGLGESPDMWLSKMEEYLKAGADMIIIDLSMTKVPPEDAINFLEKFSETIFPRYDL